MLMVLAVSLKLARVKSPEMAEPVSKGTICTKCVSPKISYLEVKILMQIRVKQGRIMAAVIHSWRWAVAAYELIWFSSQLRSLFPVWPMIIAIIAEIKVIQLAASKILLCMLFIPWQLTIALRRGVNRCLENLVRGSLFPTYQTTDTSISDALP